MSPVNIGIGLIADKTVGVTSTGEATTTTSPPAPRAVRGRAPSKPRAKKSK